MILYERKWGKIGDETHPDVELLLDSDGGDSSGDLQIPLIDSRIRLTLQPIRMSRISMHLQAGGCLLHKHPCYMNYS